MGIYEKNSTCGHPQDFVPLPRSLSAACGSLCMTFHKHPSVGSLNLLMFFTNLALSNPMLVIHYLHHVGDIFLCVLIYVADSLITRNSLSAINKFRASLSYTFHMKDLGILKYFLGIEIAQNLYIYANRSMHWKSSLKLVYLGPNLSLLS